MHDPSKCAFKNWLAPPTKKNVCKNKNTKRKLRLLSVWTSLHHYIEVILFILSNILCYLSCDVTIINRRGTYHKCFFFGFRKRIIILESSGICRNGRGANVKNAWKVANDGSHKDRRQTSSFQIFCIRETKWVFVFHFRVKSIGQRQNIDKKRTRLIEHKKSIDFREAHFQRVETLYRMQVRQRRRLTGTLYSGAPNDNFRKIICSEDDLRSRIFETFVVKFLACLSLPGFSKM